MRGPKPEFRRAAAAAPASSPSHDGMEGAGTHLKRASKEIRDALEGALGMRQSEDWSAAAPKHLVALYAQLHTHVYGVEPMEVGDAREWGQACVAAARLLGMFDDPRACVAFVAWTWMREKAAIARQQNGSRRRIGWRLQFSSSLVTDYRVDTASRQERGARR